MRARGAYRPRGSRRPMIHPRRMWVRPIRRWHWYPGAWGMGVGCLLPVLAIVTVLGLAFLRMF